MANPTNEAFLEARAEAISEMIRHIEYMAGLVQQFDTTGQLDLQGDITATACSLLDAINQHNTAARHFPDSVMEDAAPVQE